MIDSNHERNALYKDYLLLVASILLFIGSVPRLLFMWEPSAFVGLYGFFTLGSLYFIYTRGRRLYIRRKEQCNDAVIIDQIFKQERTVVRSALWAGVGANFFVAFIPTLFLISMTIGDIPMEAPILKRAECYAFLNECMQKDKGYLLILVLELLLSALVVSVWKYRTIKTRKDRLLFTLLFMITFFITSSFMYDLMFIPAFTIAAMKHGL